MNKMQYDSRDARYYGVWPDGTTFSVDADVVAEELNDYAKEVYNVRYDELSDEQQANVHSEVLNPLNWTDMSEDEINAYI